MTFSSKRGIAFLFVKVFRELLNVYPDSIISFYKS